ncbi:FliH/SctL family protein [Acidimangrovimonas sediminis]|uniref:FliH/SctL family protein n=1 Tax=Acidimangrovimonas sediminis TaxID=2056283 RepID=UPI001E2CB169|nr:flagellar biosynthesis protein [Acidimangrovimonas sediminis]
MAGRLQLEVFETVAAAAAPSDAALLDSAQIEEMRLESYEQGYKAGWEDATTAHAAEQDRIGADLARSLQTLSFTYHEARTHVLRALAPLLNDVVSVLLPVVAGAALAPQVADRIAPLAAAQSEVPVRIFVNPAARAAVEARLGDGLTLPVELVEEPTLGEGQATLRFGESEERIDLDAVVAEIRGLLAEYFNAEGEDVSHG